jgi:hypothetical protein
MMTSVFMPCSLLHGTSCKPKYASPARRRVAGRARVLTYAVMSCVRRCSTSPRRAPGAASPGPPPPESCQQAHEQAAEFEDRHGFTLLPPAPFHDVGRVAVLPEFAQAHGLQTMTSLTKLPSFTYGGPPEKQTRYQGIVGMRQAYGLTNAVFVPFTIGDQYQALLDHGARWHLGVAIEWLDPACRRIILSNWRAVDHSCRACHRGEPWYCFSIHNAAQKMIGMVCTYEHDYHVNRASSAEAPHLSEGIARGH